MRVSKMSVLGLPVALSALLLTGCKGHRHSSGTDEFPRDQTLYLAGSQWGDPTSFNPLAESWQAAWPVGDRFNLMYEPLLAYNSLTGQVEPDLGTLVSKDNDSIVVDINPAAKWSDGKPVTAADVQFYYDVIMNPKNLTSIFRVDLAKLSRPEVIDDHTLRVTAKEVHWKSFWIAGGLFAFPRQAWTNVDFNSVNFEFPVVSGPMPSTRSRPTAPSA